MVSKLEHCLECNNEIDCEDCRTGATIPEAESVIDEPVWYTLSEVINRITTQSSKASPTRSKRGASSLSTSKWQELMALAQILHDLRIHDSNQLLRKLGAVYVADDSKPLRGEYHYFGEETDPDRFYGEIGAGHAPKEAKEPRMSSRRQAIMAQKERKNESS